MATLTREERNAKARARYAAKKAATVGNAEPIAPEDIIVPEPVEDGALLPELELADAVGRSRAAATVQDWSISGAVFAEPQADRVPGTFDKSDWERQMDIKTPEGLARAHLNLAEGEVREAKRLLAKYEHEVHWRSIRPGHPQHLIDKYQKLVDEYKLVVERAEADLVPYKAAVDEFREQSRAAVTNGWLLLGHSVAEALGFGPARTDPEATNNGYTIWNPQPDMYVRFSYDGNWHVGLRDPETDQRIFGYDADIYSPRLSGGEPATHASWGSYSGMRYPADNRAQLRVLTLATRIAEAVSDYFGFPRSGANTPS